MRSTHERVARTTVERVAKRKCAELYQRILADSSYLTLAAESFLSCPSSALNTGGECALDSLIASKIEADHLRVDKPVSA